jgi:hypothetical protein
MTPGKRKAPEGTGADATTYRITGADSNTSTTRTEGSSYGLMLDRPVTTSRTCEGLGCWCHIGASQSWALTHLDEMARMAREVRAIDIAQGVIL